MTTDLGYWYAVDTVDDAGRIIAIGKVKRACTGKHDPRSDGRTREDVALRLQGLEDVRRVLGVES